MSVKYNVVPKKNPGDPAATPKYYPSVVKSGSITLRQLAKRISAISTVSTIDTLAVLEGLLTVVPEELTAGQVVHLGEFGSFWLRIKTTGAELPGQVTAHNILDTRVRFTPGKEFKQALATIDFEKN